MTNYPKITVLMPMYNSELYIREAVDSILNQTFSDFEFIIIDDASTDKSVEIIKLYSDSRIKLIQKPQNTGYTNSLNYGISIANGEYIARMDSDDISLPTRFEKQVTFLDKNDDVILCGSAIKIIDSEFNHNYIQPNSHEEIQIKLCFEPAFFHPTIMGKTSVFKLNHYNTKFEPAEDYELWTRFASLGKLANIEESLLLYRKHDNQVSQLKKEIQINSAFKSKIKMLDKLHLSNIFENKIIQIAINYEILNCNFKDFSKGLKVYDYLIKKNKELKIFEPYFFEIKINKKRFDYISNYFNNGFENKVKKIFLLPTKISFTELFKIVKLKKRFGY